MFARGFDREVDVEVHRARARQRYARGSSPRRFRRKPALLDAAVEAFRRSPRPRARSTRGVRSLRRTAWPLGAATCAMPRAHLAGADDGDLQGDVISRSGYPTFTRTASPWPPPEQIAAMPKPPPRLRS